MKKIISLFQRNYDGDRLVRDEVVPGAEWVVAGEGQATRMFDGTCCMVRDGVLYKRYDAKQGKKPPANFEPAQDYDEVTGHMPGWIPVGSGPEDKWHRQALENQPDLRDSTYELCGPKVQGDAEREYRCKTWGVSEDMHILIQHGCCLFASECDGVFRDCVPRTFSGLKEWLSDRDIEGIVWHHPDGRMVKIKKKDFGLHRV